MSTPVSDQPKKSRAKTQNGASKHKVTMAVTEESKTVQEKPLVVEALTPDPLELLGFSADPQIVENFIHQFGEHPEMLAATAAALKAIIAKQNQVGSSELNVPPVNMEAHAAAPVAGPAAPTAAPTAPTAPETSTFATAPVQSAPQAPPPVPQGPPPSLLRVFQPQLRAGFRPLAPVLLYTAAANDFKDFTAAAVDVLPWGATKIIVMLPSTSVRVLMANGQLAEVPAKVPIAVLAEGDFQPLGKLVEDNPTLAIEAQVAPSIVMQDDMGRPVVRHMVGIGISMPKKGLWPPA